MDSSNSILKSQNGQATTAAMILLPVLIVVLTTLVILGFAFVFEAKATANCRASLVASQTEARDALEQLLALNPTAQALETERQAAIAMREAALRLGDVTTQGMAEIARALAEKKQIPVRAAQARWLAQGRTASLAAPERARASIFRVLPDVVTRNASTQPNLTRAKFDVITQGPPGALTPAYRTAPGFEESQRAEVQWLLTLPRTSSDEADPQPAINIGCAITLTNEGADKWSPQILEDKLLPN